MMQQMARPGAAAGLESALPNRRRTGLEERKTWSKCLMLGRQHKPVMEMSYSIRTFGC